MTDEIGGLLGSGPTVACKVIDDMVSVHWWANAKPGEPCLCGAQSKREPESPAGDDSGWGHYDACPAARSDTCDDPDAACICPGLASEYEDERSASW